MKGKKIMMSISLILIFVVCLILYKGLNEYRSPNYKGITKTCIEVIDKDLDSVWNKVVSLDDYAWRSDIKEIIKESDNKFVEVSKEGYKTKFIVIEKEEKVYLEYKFENENMTGLWQGKFYDSDGKTKLEFTENVKPKMPVLSIIISNYLKNMQKAYMEDLKKSFK